MRHLLVVVMACLLSASVRAEETEGLLSLLAEDAKPTTKPTEPRSNDAPQPTSRTARGLEGWTIRVDDRLIEASNQEVGSRALKFLEAKLVEVKAVVPEERLKDLQSVTIVLDLNCGNLTSMQYHPSAGWLKANGYSTDLAKCVHLPRAADLPTRRNINEQPWAVLHELAHAFHDQKLGFDESRIKDAYEKYKQSGRGDKTLLYNGKRVKHYALTNPMEFFAEMTESFFGVNDFFPFNRAELQEAEPELFRLLAAIWTSPDGAPAEATRGSLKVGVFQVDATPPLGTPVAYALARKIEDPLSVRGVVLLGVGQPIVLCAVDWIGISNGGHDAWRESLASAVGTSVDRVAVHVLHQHDGVRCDFSAEELLAPHGLSGKRFDVPFVRKTIANAAQAAKEAIAKAQPVTHLGIGEAKVEKVASNRRILGPNGRVAIARSSSYRIPEPILSRLNEEAKRQGYELSASRVEEALAAPEGVIDPLLKMLTFFDGDRPVVSLSYYATHPQSYFGKGDVTSEFVGLARFEHEKAHAGLPLIHFNGASGNVAAGKYNDGTPEMRVVLTQRMADGMKHAWEATKKIPLTVVDCEWRVQPVRLPVAPHLDADALRKTLENKHANEADRLTAAGKLAYVLRRKQDVPIELSCLKLGDVYVLHMPGELFIEYQLAAQQMRPNDTVCMAAYGDTGTGYIGTQIAYSQGGYETQPSSSNTAPQVEQVLMDGIRTLLHVPNVSVKENAARSVTQIVAHRGSSADRPENTLASTRRAIEVGATAVEVDVRTTKDGVLVLSHDATLDRTTNGSGAINEKTLAEIRQLDAGSKFDKKFAGERVSTLTEVLTLCKGKIDVLLDLKERGEDYNRRVAEAVNAHGDPKRIIVGARSIEQAKRFRELIPQSRLLGLIEKPDEIETYAAAGVEMVRLWPKWLSDTTLVGRVRQAGMKLHLNGTTGEMDEVVELLKHRPDSLSSDNPARLIATLRTLQQ